jgi:hypothetical protein
LRNEGGRGAKASTGKPGGVLKKRCGRPFFSQSAGRLGLVMGMRREQNYTFSGSSGDCCEIFREADVEVRWSFLKMIWSALAAGL